MTKSLSYINDEKGQNILRSFARTIIIARKTSEHEFYQLINKN